MVRVSRWISLWRTSSFSNVTKNRTATTGSQPQTPHLCGHPPTTLAGSLTRSRGFEKSQVAAAGAGFLASAVIGAERAGRRPAGPRAAAPLAPCPVISRAVDRARPKERQTTRAPLERRQATASTDGSAAHTPTECRRSPPTIGVCNQRSQGTIGDP